MVCRGLRCRDMRTCVRRREAAVVEEVEVVSGGGGGSSRGGVPMAVMQQHVRCVHLCAEEREAAVVGRLRWRRRQQRRQVLCVIGVNSAATLLVAWQEEAGLCQEARKPRTFCAWIGINSA